MRKLHSIRVVQTQGDKVIAVAPLINPFACVGFSISLFPEPPLDGELFLIEADLSDTGFIGDPTYISRL